MNQVRTFSINNAEAINKFIDDGHNLYRDRDSNECSKKWLMIKFVVELSYVGSEYVLIYDDGQNI